MKTEGSMSRMASVVELVTEDMPEVTIEEGVLAPRQVTGLSIRGGNEYPERAECAGRPEDTDDRRYLSWPSQPGYSLLRGGNSP